jgi:hypothetical protein
LSERQSTAKKEDFQVLTDQDLLNGTTNRARQLEGERAGHMLNLQEAEAVGDDDGVKEAKEAIAELDIRLKVVHDRRKALESNMPKKTAAATSTPPQA